MAESLSSNIDPETIAAAYLALVNIAAFIAFGVDKRRAIKGAFRIPEVRLHLLALMGGFAGGFAGMHLFRHKRRKISFLAPFFLASILSAAALVYLWLRFLSPS